MFSKILFPIDGSEHSAKTMEYVKNLAKVYKCQVVIFHSYEAPYVYEVDIIDLIEQFKKEGEAIVKKAEDELKIVDINTKAINMQGRPGQLIVEVAERESCDLIIMGTYGLGSVRSLLLGATSNYVIHHTQCPVFLV